MGHWCLIPKTHGYQIMLRLTHGLNSQGITVRRLGRSPSPLSNPSGFTRLKKPGVLEHKPVYTFGQQNARRTDSPAWAIRYRQPPQNYPGVYLLTRWQQLISAGRACADVADCDAAPSWCLTARGGPKFSLSCSSPQLFQVICAKCRQE